MKFPNKVTRYRDSIFYYCTLVLEFLDENDLYPQDLYEMCKKKSKQFDIKIFMDCLDSLYALNKITIDSRTGELHYVEKHTM